jgi:pyruvate/2-oxoglutarate dehydrogenase complex dihydrolipoamide acyltransferase (E2) component
MPTATSPKSSSKAPAAGTPWWKNGKLWTYVAVGVIALGGGMTWALWPKNYDKVINELAQKGPEEIRKAVDSGAIPREVAWEAFGQAREAEMQKRVDGYFALQTAAERNRYLDKMIDEMQARMREFQQRSTTRPAGDWQRGDRRGDGPGPATQPNDARRAEREQRRNVRADTTPPAQRAQRVEFMAAMRKRMQERGIEMPNGGRGFGGFGGFGGGPGRGGDGGGRRGG